MSETGFAAERAELEAEQTRIRTQLAQMGQPGHGARLSFDEGFADSGQVTAERGEVEALAGTLAETLAEVERALAKLADGGYGVCESCGNPIAPARLEAKPAARYCINCAPVRR